MRYVSTRGGGEPVSFEAAIGAGYAPDGGLYVPETLPPITAEDLDAWRTIDFTAVAVEVLLPFLDGEVAPKDYHGRSSGFFIARLKREWASEHGQSSELPVDAGAREAVLHALLVACVVHHIRLNPGAGSRHWAIANTRRSIKQNRNKLFAATGFKSVEFFYFTPHGFHPGLLCSPFADLLCPG